MKSSLRHIPENKQAELKRIVEIVRKATKKAEIIILFGSYARGDYVDRDQYMEGHILYEYRSDYDVFVIVTDSNTASDVNIWSRVQSRINTDKNIETPVSIIPEDIAFVNDKLAMGRYFYADIFKEGVLLYDSKRFKLAKPRTLSSKEKKMLAQEDLDLWIPKAQGFLKGFRFYVQEEEWRLAAFNLHQTTESFFSAVLLVFTGYRPKTHDLDKLYARVLQLDPRFVGIFPQSTEEEKNLFELLKKAYVDARYSKSYKITKAELEQLGRFVEKLRMITNKVCLEKIAEIARP